MKPNVARLNPIALAVTLAASGNLYAQQSDELIEEVVVKGSYVKSLEKALDIKRDAVGFSDSVVAADIADFPEQNLVEALQRMPGVTIERERGLGTKVNVRSLPNQFTHVSINDLATASGSGGRDADLSIFASEIIQTVTVKKSPTAADEEGGIAGSVKISTARPFDYAGDKLVASFEGAHNSISGEVDPKFSILGSTTTDKWGALFSFSTSTRSNRTDANSGVDFRSLARWLEKKGSDYKQWQSDQAAEVLERDTGVVINDRFDDNETGRVVFINKVGDRLYFNDQEKWGATAAFQYKPEDNLTLSFDAMFGAYDTTEDFYDAANYSASSSSTLEKVHAYDDTTLAEHGIVVLTDVSYANSQHEYLSKENINNTDFSQYSLSLDWQLGAWDINAVVGYSGADKFSDRTNLKHTLYAPTRTRFTATGGETILSENPNTLDMYNSDDKYIFDHYDVDQEEISDDKYAAQLDIVRQLNLESFPALSEVQFGARYTDKSKQRNKGNVRVKGPSEGDSSWSRVRTMAESELTSSSDLTPGGGYSVRDIQWNQISNDWAREFFRYSGFAVPFQEKEFYRVDEEVLSLYAMLNFEFKVSNVPVHINTGLRSIDTDILSFGYHQESKPDGSTGYTDAPVSKDGSYSEVLPSFNLTAELTEDLVLRAAASETFMRPALGDIAYKRTVNLSSFKYYDGNPSLQPTFADQWEIGLEYYLQQGGIFAISYFEKEIAGVVREELTGVAKDVTKYNDNGTLDGIYDFDIYQKVNAEGSYDVSGVEIVAQFPLSLLTEQLDGFGVNANYTMLDNSLTGDSDLDIPTPPTGLADSTYNMTFYYEDEAFDARISYNYKDKYVQSVGRGMYPIYRDAYGQYDLSIGYQITENIKLSLKGINITDEATQAYTIDPAFPQTYELSGRRISLGFRGDF